MLKGKVVSIEEIIARASVNAPIYTTEDYSPATELQLRYINDIEKYVHVKFIGTTKHEASVYISEYKKYTKGILSTQNIIDIQK